MGTLPDAPTPSSILAMAFPVVVLSVAAVGPEVMPRPKLNVGLACVVTSSGVRSAAKPNFKLCDSCSLVAFTWAL